MRIRVLVLIQEGLSWDFEFPQETPQYHERQRNNLQSLDQQLKLNIKLWLPLYELIWLTQLLKDFRIAVHTLALLFCDNQAAIHIATNPIFHERTKYIDIDYHFVLEQVTVGLLKLMPVRTHHQLADIFTKPLPSSLLFLILSKMAVQDIHHAS